MLLANAPGETDTTINWPAGIVDRGIALTPYSYERLDSLTGYDAGMPSPGFYHRAWHTGAGAVHRGLLTAIAARLRELGQPASTADLIAVESCAQALAALRGHARVWRRDLTDAVIAALVKDDVHSSHPFVLALQAVLRGNERGRLAPGSPQPPLYRDIQELLAAAGALPETAPRERILELAKAGDLSVSRLFHRLRLLQIPGFQRTGGVDFATRQDLSSDKWQVIILVDESGSMADSVIHSAVTAAIFFGIKTLRTHLVLFDTSIVDVSADCADPVETIMKVQLGGGTDIGQAVCYAEGLIDNPRRSIVVLVTDFCEGAPVHNLYAACRRLIEQGTLLLGLAALDSDAKPHYDHATASRIASLGAHVGAMTPGDLAQWVAEKVR